MSHGVNESLGHGNEAPLKLDHNHSKMVEINSSIET